MMRTSMADIERRLVALENTHGEPPEMWITGGVVTGWELLPGNGLSERVMRLDDETDASLNDRAREAMKRLRAQHGPLNDAAIYFGVNEIGVTL